MSQDSLSAVIDTSMSVSDNTGLLIRPVITEPVIEIPEWLNFKKEELKFNFDAEAFNFPKKVWKESMIQTTSFKSEISSPQVKESSNTGKYFLSAWIIMLLITIVVIRLNSWTKFKEMIKSGLYHQPFRRFLAEYQPGWFPPVTSLYFACVFILSGYILSVWLKDHTDSLTYMIAGSFIVFFISFIVPILRTFMIYLWGWTFDHKSLSLYHAHISYLSLLAFSFLVLPFFLDQSLGLGLSNYISISSWVYPALLVLLWQMVRIFLQANISSFFSGLYIFIYLCTLEIVPIVLIYKILYINGL